MPRNRHNLEQDGRGRPVPVDSGVKPAVPGVGRAGRGGALPSSFEARFGRVILQHGIAAIPAALYHLQGRIGLKAQHIWFISYILSHKWDEELPYPSLSKMARATGITLRNLQFIRKELCDAGLLLVLKRYTQMGGQDSNAYDFAPLFEHLEVFLEEDDPTPNPIHETAAGGGPVAADPSFVARFGRVIARHGVSAVPRALFTNQAALGLTPQQVWFVSYIFSFQWTTALPYPSINRMVEHTGYSRAHLHTIKAELVTAGYLRLVRRTNDQGGQDSNAYDFSGLLDAIREQLQPRPEPDGGEGVAGEETNGKVEQPGPLFRRRGRAGAMSRSNAVAPATTPRNGHAKGDTGGHDRGRTGGYEAEQTGVYEREQTLQGVRENTPPYEEEQTGPDDPPSLRSMKQSRQRRVKRSGHESEASETEEIDGDDSNHISPMGNNSNTETKDARPQYSPYIAQLITDFSHELGNPDQVISNVTQALRLWQGSGLGEEEFGALLHDVKGLTRKYQARPHSDSMRNKMAYFFTVLRGLLAPHHGRV